jgi:hypothetical protein
MSPGPASPICDTTDTNNHPRTALLRHSTSTMKPSLFTLVLGALTMSQVQAAFPINVTATALLPHCVLDCGVSVLPPLNCSVGEPCYCARTGPVADALTACVMAGCKSLQDALKGLRYQAETCQWPTDRSLKDVGFGVNTSLVVLTTFFLIARFASRWPRWAGAGFGWDDCKCPLAFDSHHI